MNRARTFGVVQIAVLAMVVGLGALMPITGDARDTKSAADILRALNAKPPATKTRGATRALKTRGIRPVKPAASTPGKVDVTIHFAVNSARIEARSRAQVRQIASALRQIDLTQHRVEIIGHTDSRGSAQSNQALSLRRAEGVLELLVNQYNIPAARLRAEGRGEASPLVAPERTRADYARNRRVELRLLGAGE
jgi:OmpA-OmpF porin, OOP family